MLAGTCVRPQCVFVGLWATRTILRDSPTGMEDFSAKVAFSSATVCEESISTVNLSPVEHLTFSWRDMVSRCKRNLTNSEEALFREKCGGVRRVFFNLFYAVLYL